MSCSSKVLTFYLCKNKNQFREQNFLSVKNQEGIDQRIFIVSAESIEIGVPNIVVPTKSDWLLPIRVGFSVNVALKIIESKYKVKLTDFDYIFKVDSDVLLPKDYVRKLTSKSTFVAGVGPALIISVPFFVNILKKEYPVTYCDDGYIAAQSIALGLWPVSLSSDSLLIPPVVLDFKREFAYGIEYYRWGFSPMILAMMLVLSRFLKLKPHEKRSLKANVANMAGYFWAMFHRIKRYSFWKNYRKMRNRHFAEKALKFLLYFQKI
ncbi:MAG: hypothetical protein DSO07_00975 [Thermoproteota archaeon]|jgi:hypothetical protein|nr:MAG: hypothetical protein DSO07_00975 [Candidatus Korarchaeota archaeon]